MVKVNNWGYVRFASFQVYLSETFANQFLEFRANPHGGSWLACFRSFRIAQFDANTGALLKRSVWRI